MRCPSPVFKILSYFHFSPLQNSLSVKSSFNSKTPAGITGTRVSPQCFSSSFMECICFADCVHQHSPYLPAYVTCPLLDSWRQCCLSFFEGFSTLCATAQQPLIIHHIYSSSSQASFDDKPERIKSSNSSVHVMTINASLLVGCDHQREDIDDKEILRVTNTLL